MKKYLFVVWLLCLSYFLYGQQVQAPGSSKWFPHYDLALDAFRNPSQQFGPFARWWWPGNFVDSTELKREIDVLAGHGFGGVEIQPLNLFIPGGADVRAKVNTWDS